MSPRGGAGREEAGSPGGAGRPALRAALQGAWRATSLAELDEGVLRRWLGEAPLWFRAQGASRPPRRALVDCAPFGRALLGRALVGPGEGGPGRRGALAKLHRRSLLRRVLATAFHWPSAARRAFELGLRLQAAGVRAARPIAVLEERALGGVGRSALVIPLEEGEHLREVLTHPAPPLHARDGQEPRPDGSDALRSPAIQSAFESAGAAGVTGAALEDDAPQRGPLWRALGEEVARLHLAGVRQRDLKAHNILVQEGSDGAPVVVLLDLEGMRSGPRAPARRSRVRDLGRLLVSLREASVAGSGVGPGDWRQLLESYLEAFHGHRPAPEEVEAHLLQALHFARRKEAQQRRRGRTIR